MHAPACAIHYMRKEAHMARRAVRYETHVEPYLDKIEDMAKAHATEKEIAEALGIGASTLRKWKNEHPALAGALVVDYKKTNKEALGAFYSRVTGYTYTETTRELVGGKMQVTKEVKKTVPPDVGAGQFWLTNKMPDEFKNKQEINGSITTKKLEDFASCMPKD